MRRSAAILAILWLGLALGCQAWQDLRGPVRILPDRCEAEPGGLVRFTALRGRRVLAAPRWEVVPRAAGDMDAVGVFRAAQGIWIGEVRVLDRGGAVLARTPLRVIGGGRAWAASNFAEIYDPADGSVRAVGSMARPRTGHAACLLPDGRVLVAGGRYRAAEPDPVIVEVFDPRTGTFSPLDPQPLLERQGLAAVAITGGRVALVGGVPDGEARAVANILEIYDPALRRWARQELPTRLLNHPCTALALRDGSVLLWGEGIELWEPAFNGVVPIFCNQIPGAQAAGCQLADGRVLLAGGAGEAAASAWLVDVKERTVKEFQMTEGRTGAFALPLGSGSLLVGGTAREAGRPVPAASLLTVTPSGGAVEPLKGERPPEWGPGASSGSYTVLLAGGQASAQAGVFSVETTSDQVTRLPDLQFPRRNPTLTRLKDGRILIIGGDTGP